MVKIRERSPSPPESSSESLLKRLKTTHVSSTTNAVVLADPTPYFASGVFDADNIRRLHQEYEVNEPYKYALVEKLFQDDLLKNVKDECLSELSFTEKETDIYKINQTGDLASLSYLTEAQIALLPNLLILRDALYSPTFRQFLRSVTGCGPLSGSKQDMSVASYTKGCHLLNHDDVIGTRRVSYILYMPLPHYQLWQKQWGGALELYPVQEGPDGQPEPEPLPSKSIPPSWNQFIFFEVQPGKSFHSVEEVVVGGGGEDGRERLSISGWFHAAQPGEEGYVHEPAAKETRSSREQLTSTQTTFASYPESIIPPLPDAPLSESHISFLSEFFNPVYLQARTMKTLAARFVEESSLELHSFLCIPFAQRLEAGLRDIDIQDGLANATREGIVPLHTAGTSTPWTIKGPPHKWRYCTLLQRDQGGSAPVEVVRPRSAMSSPVEIVRSLQDELFTSAAFRAWLAIVSRLLPLRYAVEARRFRPGLDYKLATSEEKETRLDVVLDLTPEVQMVSSEEEDTGRARYSGWQTGEWGGWECYMAPNDEEDDPAVYRSAPNKTRHTNGNGTSHKPNSDHAPPKDQMDTTEGSDNEHAETSSRSGPRSDTGDSESEAEDNGTLLTVQPGFNRLLLVLRDEGVMHFVKYVSAAAEGSRWDVCGEYEIGVVQEEDT